MNTLQKIFDWVYEQTLPERTIQSGDALLIGHRGFKDHPKYKENTLEAFAAAVALGVGLELDVRLAACGTPMVIHDPTAQRVFGIPLEIAQYTREQWAKLEPEIPSLTEVLDALPQCPFWMIEIKDLGHAQANADLIAQVHQILQQRSLQQRVCVLALSADLLREIRAQMPDYDRAFVYILNPQAGLEYFREDPACGLYGWHWSFPRQVNYGPRGHGVGFANYPWTAAQLVGQGYKVLFGDRMDRVLG